MKKRKILALFLSFNILSTICFPITTYAKTNNKDYSGFIEPIEYGIDNINIEDNVLLRSIPHVPVETWIDFYVTHTKAAKDGSEIYVDLKTINKDTVYFTDINGNKIPSLLTIEQFNKNQFSIKIMDNYVDVGEIYTLNLTTGIKFKDGTNYYPKTYKLSIVTAPKGLKNREQCSLFNNFNIYNEKYNKTAPLTVEPAGKNFYIKTSEAIRPDTLEAYVIDSKGEKYKLECAYTFDLESSVDNHIYKLVMVTENWERHKQYKTNRKAGETYTILIKKGLTSALREDKILEKDITFKINIAPEGKTNMDNLQQTYEVGMGISDTIYHRLPDNQTNFYKVVKFLSPNGDKIKVEKIDTGEKYIVNWHGQDKEFNNIPRPLIGSIIFINRWLFVYHYDKDGIKNIDIDGYYEYGAKTKKTIKNISPTYTSIVTDKGVTISALDFNGDIYLIAENIPIDKNILGAKFPIANYDVIEGDFSNTEVTNPKIKGYVSIKFPKLSFEDYSPFGTEVEIDYDKLCSAVNGTLYKNDNSNIKAPYYIKTPKGKIFYIYHHGKNIGAYTGCSKLAWANENLFGLNKLEMDNNIGKNVIVRGIVKNDNEIIYPVVQVELSAHLCKDTRDFDSGLWDNYFTPKEIFKNNTISLDTGIKLFDSLDTMDNFKQFNDGTYATRNLAGGAHNPKINVDHIVSLTDKYTEKEIRKIVSEAAKIKDYNRFILKGALIKIGSGEKRSILYISDFIDLKNNK